jgi:hypothetical protein
MWSFKSMIEKEVGKKIVFETMRDAKKDVMSLMFQ